MTKKYNFKYQLTDENKTSILEAAKKCLERRASASFAITERSKIIEELTAEHKECKLRCQEIEKQVNKLLGSDCLGGL